MSPAVETLVPVVNGLAAEEARQQQSRPSGSSSGSTGRPPSQPAPPQRPDWTPPPPPKTYVHLTDKNCFIDRDYFVKAYTVVLPDGSSYYQTAMAGSTPELTIVSIYRGSELVTWGGLRWFYVYP